MENNNELNTIPGAQEIPGIQGPRKEILPGAIAALILGIVSLANMALFGWIPAIIAYTYHKKGIAAMEENPGKYSETSIKMANSGKKMADIGLVLGILGMIVTGIYYYFVFSKLMDSHHSYYNIY